MATAPEPADTRMMGIVHGALRRDLLRTRDAAVTEPYPRGRQRRALGEHVVWLMHGFARAYRRRARARWQPDSAARRAVVR